MKDNLRTLTRAAVMLLAGAMLYLFYGVVRNTLGGAPAPIAPATVASSARPTNHAGARVGNTLLADALLQLERRTSMAAEITCEGELAGADVRLTGGYRQLGSGNRRCFAIDLSGQLAGAPLRWTQTSDGRLLWTGLRWDDGRQNAEQSLSRVDLRRLRQQLAEDEAEAPLAPGQAAAVLHSNLWSPFGGLPTLLGGLDKHFDFGPPRLMKLQNTRVLAMVGRWNERQLRRLMTVAPPPGKSPEEPNLRELPPRLPQHVVVVLDEAQHLPRRIEYRSLNDPLSAAGLSDDVLLTNESSQPLLKIDFLSFAFEVAFTKEQFHFNPPEGTYWEDKNEDYFRAFAPEEPEQLVERTPLELSNTQSMPR